MQNKKKRQNYKRILKQTKNKALKYQIEQSLYESSMHNAGLELGGINPYACFVHLKDHYVIHYTDFPIELFEEYPHIWAFLQSGRRLTLKCKNETKKLGVRFNKIWINYAVAIHLEEDEIEIIDTSLNVILEKLEKRLLLINNTEMVRTRKPLDRRKED